MCGREDEEAADHKEQERQDGRVDVSLRLQTIPLCGLEKEKPHKIK
jgi:hypothetical protein